MAKMSKAGNPDTTCLASLWRPRMRHLSDDQPKASRFAMKQCLNYETVPQTHAGEALLVYKSMRSESHLSGKPSAISACTWRANRQHSRALWLRSAADNLNRELADPERVAGRRKGERQRPSPTITCPGRPEHPTRLLSCDIAQRAHTRSKRFGDSVVAGRSEVLEPSSPATSRHNKQRHALCLLRSWASAGQAQRKTSN